MGLVCINDHDHYHHNQLDILIGKKCYFTYIKLFLLKFLLETDIIRVSKVNKSYLIKYPNKF